jgi:hypothetical protein
LLGRAHGDAILRRIEKRAVETPPALAILNCEADDDATLASVIAQPIGDLLPERCLAYRQDFLR